MEKKQPSDSADDVSVEVGRVFVEADYANERPSGSSKQLHHTFSARHIQMIGLAGSIGSGLFIGMGKALRYGNYPGMFLGWGLICTQAWMNMQVMSEACVIFPTSGAFIDHAARFLDPALAFALGACEWFAWHTTLAAEGSVFRLILTYWTTELPTAACMTIYLAVVFGIHFMPNRWFAEFEFFTAVLKILIMVVLIITSIVMLAGGGPSGTTHHATNYTELSAFPIGELLSASFWLHFPAVVRSCLGLPTVRRKCPVWNVPRAVNNLAFRLFFFFGCSIIFVSILVPYTDKPLLGPSNIAAAPYVIALNDAGIIFTWFSSVGSTVYFLAYLVIAATNWGMRAAFKAQNDNPLTLKYAYKNKFYPLGSVFLFASGIFVIASVFYLSLFPIDAPTSASNFFQTFLCIPLFLVLWIGYKVHL
ncbi:hypothetical protein UA08_08450 [Talaromyces atroroseus]|uniref:Amino acid permease/ SLC12A domain-containing protein n=1 Tax=Talaromyces atroroseus TaxID=1441469 RepID=A0A1Q5Q7V0_TALAT|nr:hypothetical protein UA08_08450 [Talaromyces atroroseus]OKL56286.1 hypothetical protein UA08_08450 [Talaromyces atroroseus]